MQAAAASPACRSTSSRRRRRGRRDRGVQSGGALCAFRHKKALLGSNRQEHSFGHRSTSGDRGKQCDDIAGNQRRGKPAAVAYMIPVYKQVDMPPDRSPLVANAAIEIRMAPLKRIQRGFADRRLRRLADARRRRNSGGRGPGTWTVTSGSAGMRHFLELPSIGGEWKSREARRGKFFRDIPSLGTRRSCCADSGLGYWSLRARLRTAVAAERRPQSSGGDLQGES